MIRLTLRLQTPPAAFCCCQNSWVDCVIGPASGANTPERSVRMPSEMVLSVMPGPVLIAPDPPDDDELELLSELLLPQPAASSSVITARPIPAYCLYWFMQCSPRGLLMPAGAFVWPVRRVRRLRR